MLILLPPPTPERLLPSVPDPSRAFQRLLITALALALPVLTSSGTALIARHLLAPLANKGLLRFRAPVPPPPRTPVPPSPRAPVPAPCPPAERSPADACASDAAQTLAEGGAKTRTGADEGGGPVGSGCGEEDGDGPWAAVLQCLRGRDAGGLAAGAAEAAGGLVAVQVRERSRITSRITSRLPVALVCCACLLRLPVALACCACLLRLPVALACCACLLREYSTRKTPRCLLRRSGLRSEEEDAP